MSLTLVRFTVGEKQCGLPLDDVGEVLRIVAVNRIPKAPPFLEGVINRRGVITPIIDLRKRLGQSPQPYDSSTHILITRLRGRDAGLIVDDVFGVVGEDYDRPGMVIDLATLLTDDEGRAFDAAQIA